jgi:hypothetical protein
MKELPPAGSGNGGRTCFSCSCLLLLMTGLFFGITFLPPILSQLFGIKSKDGGWSYADTYAMPDFAWWSTPTCLSSCCCLGVAMFMLSIWLILIDDPSKTK